MRILSFSFLFLILVTFFSCSKDENSTSGILTSEVDGVAWKSEISTTTVIIDKASKRIAITGVAADGSIIAITLADTIVKAYDLKQGGSSVGSYSVSNGSLAFASNQGSDSEAKVVITEINKIDSTISGTFTYTAFQLSTGKKIEVRNGKIDRVKFVYEVIINNNNSFKCKINGSTFTSTSTLTSFNIGGNDLIVISGTKGGSTPSVGLYLDKNIAVGTHDLGNPLFDTNAAQYNIDFSTFLFATTGKVVISKHDKVNRQIEGTFNFDAEDILGAQKAKITEGVFSCKY